MSWLTRALWPLLASAALTVPAWQLGAAAPFVGLNTVGYPTAAKKHASVRSAGGRAFKVVRASEGSVVYEGVLSAAAPNPDTDEELAIADFSAVREPGEYRLEVADVGASAPFRVADDVYRDPFRLVSRSMYLWRCGTAVSGEHDGATFAHEACHLNDAYLDFVDGGHEKRDGVGGWHDAGDHNKYTVNAGITVGCLLRAWEDFGPRIEKVKLDLPESGGPLPEFLAEVKWEIDWLLKMQADDGSVYHKLSTKNYGGLIQPDVETDDRFFGPWGSSATASFTATLAQAARRFRPYDAAYADRCLAAARKSYDFLRAHPEYHRANGAGFTTGGYESSDWDDRLWAAAEIWEATGDAAVLTAFESQLSSGGRSGRSRRRAVRIRAPAFDVNWDWSNVKNLALFTYVSSKRAGRDALLVASVEASLIAAADEIVQTAGAHRYARTLGTRYYWGANGGVARQALVLEAAARAAGNEAYRAAQLDALNHLLGRNYYGRSFVTGLGHFPPAHPHDRRSAGDRVAAPWPGYLVGGPHPVATNWQDDVNDYRTNEFAINWNAALIYALAAQLPE
jgi:endoglucanase